MENISVAVAAIEERLGVRVRLSDPVESPPWGYQSPNAYINIGVALDSDIEPDAALDIFRSIEAAMGAGEHRNAAGEYTDRIIDIDIIAIGSLVVDTPSLTVPHPRMAQRPFVLAPMAQLAPLWQHPLLHLTASALLQRLRQ